MEEAPQLLHGAGNAEFKRGNYQGWTRHKRSKAALLALPLFPAVTSPCLPPQPHPDALSFYDQALPLCHAGSDRGRVCALLCNRATTLLQLGRATESLVDARSAIRVWYANSAVV